MKKSDIQTLCQQCLHYGGIGPQGLICDAYPAGIPRRFLDGTAEHRQPEPDQEGDYVFVEGEPEE
jgi:hypothetical protein